MNFGDAVSRLRVGEAAKLPAWRGYVKKTEAYGFSAPEWSGTSAYTVGQFVTQSSQVYICRTAISAPPTGSVNTWDASKWISTEANYDITFQELSDPASGIGHDNNTTYAFQHRQSVTSGAASVTWTVTAPTSPTLEVDAELYKAFMSSEWVVGNTSDYETARSGTGRW